MYCSHSIVVLGGNGDKMTGEIVVLGGNGDKMTGELSRRSELLNCVVDRFR